MDGTKDTRRGSDSGGEEQERARKGQDRSRPAPGRAAGKTPEELGRRPGEAAQEEEHDAPNRPDDR
ncbi:hypothetical protein EF903_23820 [Streptomyces sp. WAC05292]|uniref:hypothetical protein n=1 Tax=Streptomyces sp. WAC05292 TaxID=2487418 RepID=UPI000F7499B9|nr:hypothetical protein [Streptomyces sp. WAC05292]RSS84588.1 hypothetical protein EF903_23820 [Streptomyces sp. WAC05292]